MKDSLISISVRNLGKSYTLYAKPRDRLKHLLFRHFGKSYGKEFWALRNISFDVYQGETLGIIGRNGSGKSTLLQLIAGTTAPSTGEVCVSGRVAALLELGSGFNPEYTGRENILMNGAIIGIPKKKMMERIDDIIAFADIGPFIDQPVKTYSSGMFLRLAFAVTTGLDANILLIDEVLAVGDVFFRQKCYQRLEKLRAKGVSILLVSHAMGEVEQFCQRAILLHNGDLVHQGIATETVKRYYLVEQDKRIRLLHSNHQSSSQSLDTDMEKIFQIDESRFWPTPEAFLSLSNVSQVSNGSARCTAIALCSASGEPRSIFEQGEKVSFFYEFELLQDIQVPVAGVEIQNDKGMIVHGKSTLEYGTEVPHRIRRGSRLRFRQDIALEIAIGEYTFNLGLGSLNFQDFQNRHCMTHWDLDSRMVRLCLLTQVGKFAVHPRRKGNPVQLTHHGLANLPGCCEVTIEPSSGES